jgi:hypothetical protein
MKITRSTFCVCISAWLFVVPLVSADTLFFSNGSTVSGTVLQTNDDQIVLLTDNAAFNFKKSNLEEIKVEPTQASQTAKTERLPDFKKAVLFLSKQSWATNLTPIPATVIDKGVLRNVPYSSFHCGEDYEINVYGEPDHPAGLEIGVYRKLLDDQNAKMSCLKFIGDLLSESADKDMVWNLSQKTDYKNRNDLTFEVTPPTDMDSYGGWWISVYSEADLSRARATDDELKKISIAKAEASMPSSDSNNLSAWSLKDLKSARAATKTITFVNSSGMVISNAEVVRVIDGVGLIYKNGPTSGRMVRLADLSENLRSEYGYDAAKTEAADALAKQRKAEWQQQVLAAQAAQQYQPDATAQYSSLYPQYYDSGDYSAGYSGGGRVYVHGYYRSNGTYVNSYTRSSPHRR